MIRKVPRRSRAARGTSVGPILRSGQTCWRQALAHRFTLIVDAADYFAALKAAMIRAQKSIFLIGWDFDFRIHLDPEHRDDAWPDQLGAFINALVERKPELEIRLLKWDLGLLKTLGRGARPRSSSSAGWPSNASDVSLDHAHPLAASHHQKIVVIDDTFAFCGGNRYHHRAVGHAGASR